MTFFDYRMLLASLAKIRHNLYISQSIYIF